MNRLVFIASTWILAGLLTYLIDQTRPRLPHETQFSFLRCIFGGYLGFFMILGLVLSPPKPPNNEQENDIY